MRSEPTTLVNLEAGYRFWKRYKISAAVYNVFDSDDNDITYFYDFRSTPTGPAESGFLFHPVLPGSARVTLTCNY